MPDSTFLETYPLYKKFEFALGENSRAKDIPAVAIHVYCAQCDSEHTFQLWHGYGIWDHAHNYNVNERVRGSVVGAIYRCTSCLQFQRHFLLKVDPEGKYVMKVGQEPAWDISIEKTLAKALGARVGYFKKGLINESQGYGIGAFSYYRRVVEEIIDELLSEIADLLADEEQQEYRTALEEVKKTRVAQDKIKVVKDLLPPILRPANRNPLSILHGVLSEGLHGLSDEECIDRAAAIRQVLSFLISEVSARKAAAKSFTESMQVLLDRKGNT